MAHRVSTALAGPNWDAMPAHQAPNADAFGNGVSNVTSFTATAAAAHIFIARPTSTLVRITLSAPCRILANGGTDISATGFLTDAASESFSIPAGASISFQAAAADVAVQVLEG